MSDEWKTIDSAPKDGTRILLWRRKNRGVLKLAVVIGLWNPQRTPTYWSLETKNGGAAYDDDLVGWRPLPPAPGAPT